MMRTFFSAFALLFALCSQAQAAQPQCMVSLEEALARHETEQPAGALVLEERGQKAINCNGHEFVVPPVFRDNAIMDSGDPKACGASFLNIDERNCTAQHVYIELAADPYCGGSHGCSWGTFTMASIANKMAHEQLMQIMPYYTKAVTIRDGVKGYYIEGTCYAYCNDDRIVWEMEGKIFTLSVRSGRGDVFFIKAANDYIDAARAHESR